MSGITAGVITGGIGLLLLVLAALLQLRAADRRIRDLTARTAELEQPATFAERIDPS